MARYRLGGVARARFLADGRGAAEYDAISDDYLAQAKPGSEQLGKRYRNQIKRTFEKAMETERTPYFHFQGEPRSEVLNKIGEYAERYGADPVIDINPLDIAKDLPDA